MTLWRHRGPDDEAVDLLQARYASTLEGGELAAGLNRLAAGAGLPPVEAPSVVAQPLVLRRGRFIVAVDAVTAAGPVALIAKGYVDDRAGRAYGNHRALWDAGLSEAGRAWGVIESLGVLVTERLPGEHPAGDDVAGARLAAQATARLHACPARLAPQAELEVVLDNLDRRMRLLAQRVPDLEPSPLELAHEARSLAGDVATDDALPVNGDLSRESFLIDDGRTHMIDWDLSCAFDPAFDVGHYVAQARRYQLKHRVATDDARAAFIAAYVEAAGVDEAFLRRVDYYEAIVDLHKAHAIGRAGAPIERSVALVEAAALALALVGG